MIEKKCKNCGSWNDVNKEGMSVGLCKGADALFNCLEWNHKAATIQFTDDCKDIMMFCQDGCDWRAHLYTRPEHYCSSWSVRE